MTLQKLLPSFLAGALFLLAGCTKSDVKAFKSISEPMRAAESIEFLTIDPQVFDTTETLDEVNGHRILGRATLNHDRVGVILDGLEAMVAAGDSRYIAACFNPGYALREPAPGGTVILICLECSRVKYAREGNEGWSPLSKSAAPELDRYLADLVKESGMPTYLDP